MTYLSHQSESAIRSWFIKNLKAKEGHFVIRVYPDFTFKVFVLDCEKKIPTVISVFGPYK
jgi:hypothetical protein